MEAVGENSVEGCAGLMRQLSVSFRTSEAEGLETRHVSSILTGGNMEVFR